MKKPGSGPDGHIRVAVHKSQGRLLRVVLGKPTSDGPSTLVDGSGDSTGLAGVTA